VAGIIEVRQEKTPECVDDITDSVIPFVEASELETSRYIGVGSIAGFKVK
jgi:hypothetical protein